MSRLLTITNYATKVGIQDQGTIKKADNLLQALDHKTASKTINDAAKTLICLELAAGIHGMTFSKETAIKLSALRKTAYQNSLNNVSKILDLDKKCTVQELCVQIGCAEVTNLANSILESYSRVYEEIKDIKHPQYTAAAVFTACKVENIKIKKEVSKLISMSHLKAAQWKELTEEFMKFYNSLGSTKVERKNEENMEVGDDLHIDKEQVCDVAEEEPEVEEYQVWKARIMNEAMEKITKSVLH